MYDIRHAGQWLEGVGRHEPPADHMRRVVRPVIGDVDTGGVTLTNEDEEQAQLRIRELFVDIGQIVILAARDALCVIDEHHHQR